MLKGQASRARYVALDLSRDMLRMTCKVNSDLRELGRLSSVKASVSSLPFQDASFDAILACETTYFWMDLGQGLKECRRVLCEGGRLFLVQETWDAPQWQKRNDSWQKGFKMTFHSLEGYRSLLGDAGFGRTDTRTEENKGWFVMEASVE